MAIVAKNNNEDIISSNKDCNKNQENTKKQNFFTPEENAIQLIQNFLGFKITLEKTKFTEDELKEIVEFIKNNKLLKFFPFLAPLNILVKMSESNKHKLTSKTMAQLVNDSISSEVMPGFVITFLQCLIYNKAAKSIKPKDVLNLLSKTKDVKGVDLEESLDENSDVLSTKRFVCTAANIPTTEENKISLVKKAIESKDDKEVEKILSGELYPLITDSLFARISPYYSSIYQKAKCTKENEYTYVEIELGGLKALCVFKVQSVEEIKHKTKFDKCKLMQEAMTELEIIKINEGELKEILHKYIPGAQPEKLG